MWFMYVSNGRILSLLPENMIPRKINSGKIALLCIFLEDIPQLVLTYLIEKEFTAIGTMNLVSSSYDMILKLCETMELRHEEVILKQLLHHERMTRQKSHVEMRLREQAGSQDIDIRLSDLLSLVQYLIENADYYDAIQKCNEIRQILQQDKTTPFTEWSQQIIEFFEKFFDENYIECVKKFNNSLIIFQKIRFSVSHNSCSVLMMDVFLHCLTCCYDGLLQKDYDDIKDRFDKLKDAHVKIGNTTKWEFMSKVIYFEADYMPEEYVVDTESWKAKFKSFIDESVVFGISENSQILTYARHGMARLYFWNEDDIHAALKHMNIVQQNRQLAYKNYDIRYLQATLDLFMFFVFSCDFQKAGFYGKNIQDGLLEYKKHHHYMCTISYYRMTCKYHILCAMIPKTRLWKQVPLVFTEKETNTHVDYAEFCKTEVMRNKKKHILNIELLYLFAMYADRCGNLQNRKKMLKKCESYGNDDKLYSSTLVMRKATKALVSWDTANICFTILSLPKMNI